MHVRSSEKWHVKQDIGSERRREEERANRWGPPNSIGEREMSARLLAELAWEGRKEGGVLGRPTGMGHSVEERRDREEGRLGFR